MHLFFKVHISSFFKKPKPVTDLQKALLFSVSLCSFSHLVMRLRKLNWVCFLLDAVISAPSKLIQNHCIQYVHTSVAEARWRGKRRLLGKKMIVQHEFPFQSAHVGLRVKTVALKLLCIECHF